MVQRTHVMPFNEPQQTCSALSQSDTSQSLPYRYRTLPYAQLSIVKTILLRHNVLRRLLTAANCVNLITTAIQSIENDCKI